MTTITATVDVPAKKAPPVARHGVDTPTLLATINAVAGQPELARNSNSAQRTDGSTAPTAGRRCPISRAPAVSTATAKRRMADGDHPAVLCGADRAPTPVEWVLHALATCLTAGIANIAAARGVTLQTGGVELTSDIDLRGLLGLSKEVRNGYERMSISFRIEGDAPPEKLRAIVEQSRARSAVFDMLTNGVPIAITTKSGR